MVRFLRRSILVAGLVGFVLVLSQSGAYAQLIGNADLLPFPTDLRAPCGGAFAEAAASFTLLQTGAQSTAIIQVSDASPDTLYTVWPVLTTQGSPLTGARVTPMAPTTAVNADLVSVTPNDFLMGSLEGMGDDGTGTMDLDQIPNGFRTNRQGNGRFIASLDFPLNKGAYPFQDVDLMVEGLEAVAFNFALVSPPAVFAVVSHCTDDSGHGLVPGANEMWFLWNGQFPNDDE